ncbi:YndM family protein [Planococcus sp. YIM B11945]|uniref:YndM family protein n=1 Tax=Planococcus sp. YIM B11945 TaxID=3435410 RepID=UPI003D7DD7AA
MKHVEAFIMKYAMTFVVLFLVLGIAFGVEIADIALIALAVSVIGFIGDLVIYPRTSNKIAVGGDFVLSFVVIWLLGMALIENPDFSILMAAIYSAVLIAVGEWFFHIYLSKRVFGKKETSHTLKHEPKRY